MLLDQDQKGLLSIRLEREKPGPIQELEKAIEDAVSDLPLGKALHLLLNVHRHVFDKAVDTIQTCDASQLVLAMTDSPTVRAIVSIEHYLLQSDITTSFQHVYGPLKEKILKKNTQANTPAIRIIGYFTLQSKQTTDQVQAILKNELTMMEDKRSQLACVVLLQSLFSHVAGKERHGQFIIDLVPLLIHIAEKQSKPTLLACSSCELAIQLLQSILTQPAHPIIGNTKIQVVEEVNTINHLSTSWHQIGRVLFVLEKWHAQKGPLEAAAYQQLHQILQHKDHLPMWNELFVWLTPKAVATEKPISFKKQKKILASVHLQFAKLVVLTLLQKGEWYHLSTVHSTEQDEIETHIQEEYNTLLSMDSPFLVLLPSLIATLPHLFSTENVCHPALIQTILDQTTDTTSIKRLVPMVLKEPESPICNALWHIAQQDDRADFSFRLLTCLIQQDSESVLSILQGNLIPLIKSSDKACELLIECMSFIRLPILIQKLMKKAIQAKENERERMTYIALISKALLHETWKSDSILYYIELLRDIKAKKSICMPSLQPIRTPKELYPIQQAQEEMSESQVSELIHTVLVAPIQLWSSKIDQEAFKSCLVQLVHYSYGIPRDMICIDAWKNLSFAFMNQHQLIWPVIEQCLIIMKRQPIITKELISINTRKLKETILFLRLNPMLILQTIPKEAYDIVSLPKSYVNVVSNKLVSIDIPVYQIKMAQTNKHTQLCIELADELLSRSFEPRQLDQDLVNPVDFSIKLLKKIFL